MASDSIKRAKVPTYIVWSTTVSLTANTSKVLTVYWSDIPDLRDTDEVIFGTATAGDVNNVYSNLDYSFGLNAGTKQASGIVATLRLFSPTTTGPNIYIRLLVLR